MAQYVYKEHLVERQFKAEVAMLKELRAGDFTLEHPLIKYNLYEINPLSAVIAFTTPEKVAITLRVKGKTEAADITQTFPPATEHVLPVVGLYPNYENTIELYPWQQFEKKVSHTISTPQIEGADLVDSMETTPEYLQDNIIFLCAATSDLAFAVDYAGDIRLKLDIPMLWDVKVMDNGHLLTGTDRLLKMPYFITGMYEFSPVGKIYKEYRIPYGYHHDQCILPNGDIVALSSNGANGTAEDALVVIDKDTGYVKKTINYNSFLDPGASKSGSWSDEDWFHCNAVWYDKNTNSLTLSGRHANAMVNIDFDSGELNWIISDPEGWPEKYHKYLFKPVGDDFEWQYEQHSALITPLGDVMCFDNHHYGSQNKANYKLAKDSYSRGVIFRIDTEKMTIEQVYQYGKERGSEFFSPYISNTVYYNEGHYMIHSGGVAYDGKGVPSEALGPYIQMEDPNATLKSITVEVNHGKKELELVVNSNYYRAEKFPLYTKGKGEQDLILGKGIVLGDLGETLQMDADVGATDKGDMISDDVNVRLTDEADMFTFQAKFEKGQLVLLVLEGKDDTRQYFISTARGYRGAMCSGTFLMADARETRTGVSKSGMHGEYKVKVIIDDTKYDTGLTIKA